MKKRLKKSSDSKLFGVCGGIAEYFNIDPTIVRVATAVLTLFTGVSLIAYVISAICMPSAE